MSGSPKYTSVRVSAARRQRDQMERARRAAERRRRQAARAARQRELAAQQRARAQERAQRDREREARQLQASLEDGRNAVSSRLAGIRAMLDGTGADAGAARALRTELDELQARIQAGTDLAGYERAAEALRARAVDLQRGAVSRVTPAGRSQLISELRLRLSAVPATDVPADQLTRCDELVTALADAAAESAEVRFEALAGTAEQAIASLEWRARQTAADRQPDRPEPVATVPAGTGQDEDEDEDELADIAARLELIRGAAEGAIADAAAFGETELGRMLQDTLHAAVAAVSAGPPAEASARVARLEEMLPGAEATLDDSQASHQRRTDLAAALQDLLADHGMAFVGGSDEPGRLLLQFERPTGAIYTATISDADDGELALSYAIDGEQDVPVLPAPGAAVCDQTEDFLEAVHAGLAGRGFEAGELLWDGKPARRRPLPPGSRARPLPSSETRRRHG